MHSPVHSLMMISNGNTCGEFKYQKYMRYGNINRKFIALTEIGS